MAKSADRAIMRALIVLLQSRPSKDALAAIKRLKQELGEDYGDGPW